MAAEFTERAVLFRRRLSLVGILTRPAAAARNEEPAIVILNTGIVHRVGHHRMYVTLARVLAGAGRTVLRFDFAGIGDSEQGSAALSPLDSCMADIKDALDFLGRDYGVSRCVLIGLCSGSDNAVCYGYRDPRVVGLVLMDPSIPPTARYYFHYIAQRLTRLRHWISVATGRSGLVRMLISHLIRGVGPLHPATAAAPDNVRSGSPLAESYQRSVDSGIQILAVVTLSSVRQTYREQLIDAFPDVSFKDQLKLESFPDSDHLFTREKDRVRLTSLVADWLGSTSYRR